MFLSLQLQIFTIVFPVSVSVCICVFVWMWKGCVCMCDWCKPKLHINLFLEFCFKQEKNQLKCVRMCLCMWTRACVCVFACSKMFGTDSVIMMLPLSHRHRHKHTHTHTHTHIFFFSHTTRQCHHTHTHTHSLTCHSEQLMYQMTFNPTVYIKNRCFTISR